ncbi:hypothetical protein QJS10_CPB17g00251 [Acorus calamus]|uniref:Uncharacterized protein n=1 Tax=Acorus calamus TaxID=4465 RepID=A0AAV9CT52_ACOCL|nr:hypothetical protein QJS10_CPB17g00251 [Acorus calamus]
MAATVALRSYDPTRRNPLRKRSAPSRRGGDPIVPKAPSSNLVMENVRILRRGEKPQNAALATDRRTDGQSKKIASVNLDPSPSIISPASVDRRSDGSESAVLFAGSVSVNSPPPNSLPIPKFLGRGLTCPIRDNILALLRLDLG